nr:MAG TPA: hypothetical protein [Caudoviricetes sp.]DAY37575.1 MAG TPA: hypothetical protein [Caudoviricetes sp.]
MKKLPIYQIHRCASIHGEATTDYYIDFDEFKQRLELLTMAGYAVTEVYSAGHRNIVDIEHVPSMPSNLRRKLLHELHFANKDDSRKYRYHILFDHHYGTNDQKEYMDFIGYYNGLNCLINDLSIEHGKDGTTITVYIKAKCEGDDVTTVYKKHEEYFNNIIEAFSFANRLNKEDDSIMRIYLFGNDLTKENVKEKRQILFDNLYKEYSKNGFRECVNYEYMQDVSMIKIVFIRGEEKGFLPLDYLFKHVHEIYKRFEE